MHETNKTPEFLSKFPMGKVPALECADGFCLAESAAIVGYIAGSGPAAEQLLGPFGDAKTRARIAEWTFFAENEIVGNVVPSLLMCLVKLVPYDEERYNFYVANTERALRRIEAALEGGRKFLVGENVTLADIMVAGALFPALGYLIDTDMRKVAPGAVKYLEDLSELPEFKGVFGTLNMVETRVKP
jgi:elongation factor 1-gamma